MFQRVRVVAIFVFWRVVDQRRRMRSRSICSNPEPLIGQRLARRLRGRRALAVFGKSGHLRKNTGETCGSLGGRLVVERRHPGGVKSGCLSFFAKFLRSCVHFQPPARRFSPGRAAVHSQACERLEWGPRVNQLSPGRAADGGGLQPHGRKTATGSQSPLITWARVWAILRAEELFACISLAAPGRLHSSLHSRLEFGSFGC
jgi:hypothetical protein